MKYKILKHIDRILKDLKKNYYHSISSCEKEFLRGAMIGVYIARPDLKQLMKGDRYILNARLMYNLPNNELEVCFVLTTITHGTTRYPERQYFLDSGIYKDSHGVVYKMKEL